MSFFHDLASDLHFQAISDSFRKSVQTAAHIASTIPAVAANITGIVQKYPHMTPGVTLSLAQAGYGPNDSLTDTAAHLAAQRKIDSGMGWHSVGDTVHPTSTGMLAIAGIHFPEAVANTLKGAAEEVGKGLGFAGKVYGSAVAEQAKNALRISGAIGQSGGQFADALMRNGVLVGPEQAKKNLLQTTVGQSIKSLASGNNLGLGSGFQPAGPAAAAATAASLTSGTLTYNDHTPFSLHGSPTGPTPQVATSGRLVAKTVFQPGSIPFSIASGLIDAAKSWTLDPLAAGLKGVGESRVSSTHFTPEDLGASHPDSAIPTLHDPAAPFTSADEILRPGYVPPAPTITTSSIHPHDLGMADGTRPTVLPGQIEPWLNLDRTGIQTVNNLASNSSPYDIFLRMGGMDGNVTPELTHQLAAASTPDDIRAVLSGHLGTDLLTKPNMHLGLTDRLDNIRLLQNLPDISPTDLNDSRAVAQQLILHSRNAKAPEALTEQAFNAVAAATSGPERGLALNQWELDLAHHIATTDLSGPLSSNVASNFDRLRGAFNDSADAHLQITRDQIAMKAPVQGILTNGILSPLGSPYLDQELYDTAGSPRMYNFPDVRAIRRVTSTYGRLLQMSHLDVPIDLLIWLQDKWKYSSFIKPAAAIRAIGMGHANMAARGMDSFFGGNRLDALGIILGREQSLDHLGNAIDYAADNNKFAQLIRDRAADSTSWEGAIKARSSELIPKGADGYNSRIAEDIFNLHEDDVTRRLASNIPNPVQQTQAWLNTDEAAPYRARFDLTPDDINGFVINRANELEAKTSAHPSLMEAVRTGNFNNTYIREIDDQGNQSISLPFKNHINSLADQGLLPDSTIGGIITPRARDHFDGASKTAVDWLWQKLFKQPVNYLMSNPAYKQLYFSNLPNSLPHMAEDVQAAVIASAEEQGLSKSGIQALRDIAARRSGNLTSEEAIDLTKAYALRDMKAQFFNMYDHKQGLDIARLLSPFGNMWGQEVKVATRLLADRPQVLPRAQMLIHGATGSGFFAPNPQTGQESFNIPGSSFLMKQLTGVPFAITPPVSSVASYGSNALLPGFGPITQFAANTIIPNKPQYDDLRKAISPFGAPEGPNSLLPSWFRKAVEGGVLNSPSDTRTWANTVQAVMQYNASTGHYDLSSDAGKQKLEDDSQWMARKLYLFTGMAQFTLPLSPTPQDVIIDKNGQQTLTFAMTQKYQQLVQDDIAHHTDLALSRFVDEFGMKNLLGMQSATAGTGPVNQAGYDWARNNPDIMRTYPNIYSLFAPNDGGFSQQAYDALFKNGQRRILTPAEAIDAANSRVATMIYRNAKDAVGLHPNPAQTQWLADVKSRLISQYNGWNPDYVGTKIPGEIRQLQKAAADPRLASAPATKAIQAYFNVRDQAIAASGLKGNGWQQSPNAVQTREYLRQYAAYLISKVPEFKSVYDDLLSHEMKDDVTVSK